MAKRKRGSGLRSDASKAPSAAEDKAASKLRFTTYEDLADSEDEFHINRDKIALSDDRDAKRSRQVEGMIMRLFDLFSGV